MKSWTKQLIIAAGTLMMAFSAWALDVNRATAQELQEIKGIGPVMAERIIKERKKGEFASWQDLQERVNGVADGKSKQFSKAGLTVGKATYQGISATESDGKKATRTGKSGQSDSKPEKQTQKQAKKESASSKGKAKDAKSTKGKSKGKSKGESKKSGKSSKDSK